MLRALSNWMSTKWSGNKKASKARSNPPSVQLNIEVLEARDVPSTIPLSAVSVVQKNIDLVSIAHGGQLLFDGTAAQSGASYPRGGTWKFNGGDDFILTSTGSLSRTTEKGVYLVVATGVQDFAIDYEGGLWFLYKSGNLVYQTGNDLSNPGNLQLEDTNVSFLTANYSLPTNISTQAGGNTVYVGGDVYAISASSPLHIPQITDYSRLVANLPEYYNYQPPVPGTAPVDFSFGGGGNMYVLVSAGGQYTKPGTLEKLNITSDTGWTQFMTDAYLATDWQNPFEGGYDGSTTDWSGLYAAPGVSVSYGDQHHGMVVNGILSN